MAAKKPPTKSSKVATIVPDNPDNQTRNVKRIGGSQSDDWNNTLAVQTFSSLWLKNSDTAARERQLKATVAGLIGIGPRDEIEGMIAAQLIAAHNAAMECYRRAMIGDQTFEGRRENLGQANKLSRTHAVLLEALNRHRGKGQQKVTVEHVHVHPGGQAVVGVVQPMGGGHRQKSEDQPHAKQIGHALQSTLCSHDSVRGPVPVASDGERPLPDARGQVERRSSGQRERP